MTEIGRYKGKFLEMVTEEVALPNGRSATLDLIRHPGASAIVPFLSTEKGAEQVLLIRQYRHAAGGTIYEVPAGKLEPDEDPELCATRELEEETGYRAGRLERLGEILTTPGFTDEKIHLFAAFELEPAPQALEADEIIELAPMPLRAALDLIWSGELTDAKSVTALLHAARLLGG
ncbi:MAG: NUDIX hydrolase [Myxococcota bacterium]|jgi:ADP-ribose pyrophosphatase|nr:NUDIX hydrolase [Myxococcota bacterium]